MKLIITAIYAAGPRRYYAIGNPQVLSDAAYDAGALGVTVMVLP